MPTFETAFITLNGDLEDESSSIVWSGSEAGELRKERLGGGYTSDPETERWGWESESLSLSLTVGSHWPFQIFQGLASCPSCPKRELDT